MKKMGDPSIGKNPNNHGGSSNNQTAEAKRRGSQNISQIKLQLEHQQKDISPKMSGRLFNNTMTTAGTETNEAYNSDQNNTVCTNNNNSIAAVHRHHSPHAGSIGDTGPEMTSTPSSEYGPYHSFCSAVGGANNTTTGSNNKALQHSGINLHLDLRGCADVTMAGHPLQRVITPSPVTTPTQVAWNDVPLSSKNKPDSGGGCGISSNTQLREASSSSLGKRSADEEDHSWCQCHLKEPTSYNNNNHTYNSNINRKKPHIFTTQESVHEPTAGLKQYPNGQRYLCTSCRHELLGEQGRCPSCPHSTDCSAFSSLETEHCRGGLVVAMPATSAWQQQQQQFVHHGGIKPHETVINMNMPQQQPNCDIQNRDNEHMVSSYPLDGYGRKDSRRKCRWLKKPYVLIPLCMLLCALLAVGTFYLLTNRRRQPTVLPNVDTTNTTKDADSGSFMRPLQQDPICVKCVNLKLSADPRDDFSRTLQRVPNPDDADNENEMLCCAQSTSQLQQILDAIFETKTRQDQSYGESRPVTNNTRNNLAALLYLGEVTDAPSDGGSAPAKVKATSSEEEDDNMPSIENPKIVYGWTSVSQSGAGFVRPEIKFDESRGRLTVTRNGLYQVYTKLLFQPVAGSPNPGVFFTQKIMKENINFLKIGPVELLRDTQYLPCPNVSTTHPCHSSALSAVVYLKRGDEIFVEATHGDQIVRDQLSSFFGIYYID